MEIQRTIHSSLTITTSRIQLSRNGEKYSRFIENVPIHTIYTKAE